MGYHYECLTDADLDADPSRLGAYSALMIVGHNEYWTQAMRDGVAAYLAGGGNVLCLSGNTAFWRVGYDQETRVLETRKTTHPGEGTGVGWLPPEEWGEHWHTDGRPGGKWSYLAQAPSELLGLETLGWIDSGDRTAFAPYPARAPDHFLMRSPEPVPLIDGALLGTRSHDGPAVSGYEMDGLPEAQGRPALPPEGLTLLGHADHGPRFVAHWGADRGYGADLIYWERPADGRVFNAGATNYAGALAADPGIQALTRNVLHHMGVARARPCLPRTAVPAETAANQPAASEVVTRRARACPAPSHHGHQASRPPRRRPGTRPHGTALEPINWSIKFNTAKKRTSAMPLLTY
jgi:hypothetical protein